VKIKVQFEGAGQTPRDLLITADAAATVGDVANYLRHADPQRRGVGVEEDFTISLRKESQRLLDPRTPLGDSPLRSGAAISLLPASRQFTSNERTAVAVATILEGPGAGREIPLASGTNIVGRDRTCEVRLEDPLVSRQHARLNVTDHIKIMDLGSANGIELNGSLVSSEVVRPSDTVRFGDTVLTFRVTQLQSESPRVSWRLGYLEPAPAGTGVSG
jgi:S-DNA-T family DNA segregation ATPase FtsK/SpoIIIE